MEIPTSDKVRIVTAASLFDGHDAAINIMRRIMQSLGAEIIHLGHNRSVHEIVECAIEEDAHGIAITSYQGGHVEFFKYMKDLLDEAGCGHIKLFGGGGGTILPSEIEELQAYGITRIYSPDDGREMGLEGMIQDVITACRPAAERFQDSDYYIAAASWDNNIPLGKIKDSRKIARAITLAELGMVTADENSKGDMQNRVGTVVLGITGTGGAGKSSVTDELVRRFLISNPDKTLAIISVDPSKKKTGGALLGDRIRMNAISSPRIYMRSMATREDNTALSSHVQQALDTCKNAGFHLIILESAGVGQSDTSILDFCDVAMYVMTPEYGAPSQLEKINMLDYADVVCINKFDKAGALDALADVRKTYKRNHKLWTAQDEQLPIIGTVAAQFNDSGVNKLFSVIIEKIAAKTGVMFMDSTADAGVDRAHRSQIIPPNRVRYLSEIVETVRDYDKWAQEQSALATKLYQLDGTIKMLKEKAD